MHLLVLSFILLACPVSCWIPEYLKSIPSHPRTFSSVYATWAKAVTTMTRSSRASQSRLSEARATSSPSYHEHIVRVVASSGVNENELPVVLEAVGNACDEEGLPFDTKVLASTSKPDIPASVPGALGRVVLLHAELSEERIWDLQSAIAEEMDQLLYSDNPDLKQPVLISVRNEVEPDNYNDKTLTTLIEQEVQEYDLALPLPHGLPPKGPTFIPSLHVEIDGAHVTETIHSTTFWDTSTVLVFDDLVSDDLRARLLDVVLDRPGEPIWNDIQNGPDPRRWVRGGLLDTPKAHEETSEDMDGGPCWGLTDEAIYKLCFEHHDAVAEFENILSALYPDFVVTRLPEAVFGSSVSPLTANAPTGGDVFDYHIDGDPSLAPPSPWTDLYGRYPNRMRGKPRFMSCLLYLNDEWDAQEWGAPTRFLDTPTDQYYDLEPRPGRCVMMDQDIRHTVVAPNAAAGNRPRYSLVWKLVLHPRVVYQDMTDLPGVRKSLWPAPVFFGSASREKDVANA